MQSAPTCRQHRVGRDIIVVQLHLRKIRWHCSAYSLAIEPWTTSCNLQAAVSHHAASLSCLSYHTQAAAPTVCFRLVGISPLIGAYLPSGMRQMMLMRFLSLLNSSTAITSRLKVVPRTSTTTYKSAQSVVEHSRQKFAPDGASLAVIGAAGYLRG